MHRKTVLAVAALASGLMATSTGAQVLGGGVGAAVGGGLGGLGGSLGGGLGAAIGGVGGSLAGSAGARGDADLGTVIGRTQDAAGDVVTTTRDGRGRLIATTRDSTGRVLSRTRVTADAATQVVRAAPDAALSAADVRRRQVIVASGVAPLPPREVDVYMDREIVELRRGLAGTGVEVTRRGEGIVMLLPSDVTFAFDKSAVQPRFYRVLDHVARTLNRYPATFVDITGHTDSIGTDAYNQRLSERRASAVSAYLRARGALPQRLLTAGRGELDPIASNATVRGRAANRRVEIELRPIQG